MDERIVDIEYCMTCEFKKLCICSPVNELNKWPGMRLRPIMPWPGPEEGKCISYVKEEEYERLQ